jgi:uncharacterized protein (DUF2336 family)
MATASSTILIRELDQAITAGSPERRLEMLRRVTEQLLSNAARLDEEHIELFDDVLLRLTKTIEATALAQLSTSLTSIVSAPKQTVRTLAYHSEIAVSGPVLAKSSALSDRDLVSIATMRGQEHLLAISKRAAISEVVTDTLLERGNTDVTRTLAKNNGARFSGTGFTTLVKKAETDPSLTEELGQRSDIPPRVLKELVSRATHSVRCRLLASAAPERRQNIQSTISAVASELEHNIGASKLSATPEHIVHALNQSGKLNEAVVLRFATIGQIDEVRCALALMCSVHVETIEVLANSRNHEGLVLACKAARLSWETTELILSKAFNCLCSENDLRGAEETYHEISQPAAMRTLRFMQAKSTLQNIV